MRAVVYSVDEVELYAESDADEALIRLWGSRHAQVGPANVAGHGVVGLAVRFAEAFDLVAEAPVQVVIGEDVIARLEKKLAASEPARFMTPEEQAAFDAQSEADGGGRC